MSQRRIFFRDIPGARVEIHEQEIHTACPGGHAPYAATITLPDGHAWETRSTREREPGLVDALDVDWTEEGGGPMFSGLEIRDVTAGPGLWSGLPIVPTREIHQAFGLA